MRHACALLLLVCITLTCLSEGARRPSNRNQATQSPSDGGARRPNNRNQATQSPSGGGARLPNNRNQATQSPSGGGERLPNNRNQATQSPSGGGARRPNNRNQATQSPSGGGARRPNEGAKVPGFRNQDRGGASSWQPDNIDNTRRNGEHGKHDIEPFGKPGMIIPGLKFSRIMQLMANMYHADTIKDAVQEVCSEVAPILAPLIGGEDIVQEICSPFTKTSRIAARIDTSQSCMEIVSNIIAQEQMEHPYSGDMGNPGFDYQHDDGLHFDYYDQHQDMNANFMGGMNMNRTFRNYSNPYGSNAENGPKMDQHFSPGELIIGTISMLLMDLYGGEIPQHIIEPIIGDVFELNPNDPSDICSTVGNAIFEQPGSARDWIELGFNRAFMFFARITPWTCSLEQQNQQQGGGPSVGFEMSMGPIFQRLLMFFGQYDNRNQLCKEMVPWAENFKEEPVPLKDKVDAMTTGLLKVVEKSAFCEATVEVINSVFSTLGMEGSTLDQMMGFASDNQLCQFVMEVFGPESTLNQEVDVERFMFQERDYNNYNSLDGNPNEDPPPPPFDEALKIAGRIYTAGNLQEGFSEFCDIFDQSGRIYDILGPTMSEMCTGGRDRSSWTDMCRGHLEGYGNHDDERRYEDHGMHGHDDPMMIFYDHDSPLHGVMKILATRFGLFDPVNPYSICDSGVDVLQTPMKDLISMGKEIAAMILAKSFESDYPETLCIEPDERTGGESIGANPMEPSVEDLVEIVAMAANVINHKKFCELISTVSGTSSEQEDSLKAIATKIVDNLFTVISDSKTCNAVMDVVFAMSPEMVSFFSGMRSSADACKKIIYAFNSENSNKLDLPNIPNIDALMNMEAEPFQNPGELLPFLSVEDLLQAIGKLYNQRNPLQILSLLCEKYGRLVSQIPEVGTLFTPICNAIERRDTDELRKTCYAGLVPLIYGPEHPVVLRTINVPWELAKILLPMVKRPVILDGENICQAQEEFINSDLKIPDVIDSILGGFIPILVEYLNGFCDQLDVVKRYLAPKPEFECYRDYNGTMIAWDGTPCEEFIAIETKRFNIMFAGMLRIASTIFGYQNDRLMCTGLTNIIRTGTAAQLAKMVTLINRQMYSFIFESGQCSKLLNQYQSMVALDLPVEEFRQMIHLVTGFRTNEALCIETARLFNRLAKEVCRGLIDCAGVCNGKAVRDCAGECMGPAIKDCAGVCKGDAYLNDCGFCVGGRTRRKSEFGTDRCGVCTGGGDYRITFDCYGTCAGSAVFDKCGVCVGGDTGRLKNANAHRIDCRGLCDGGWVADQCGYCNPPPKGKQGRGVEVIDIVDPSTTSKYMDCSGACHRPGTRVTRMAHLNDCGMCIGGTTGLEETEGMNVCNQCFNDTDADPTSCIGCDGVAQSGLEMDACGVCGGSGTDCMGVSAVYPKAIQANSPTNLVIHGAGFSTTRSKLKCVFSKSGSSSTFDVIKIVSTQEIACQANLAAGTYDVKVERDGFVSDDVSTTLVVFADIPMIDVTPTDVDLDGETFDMYMTAEDDGAFSDLKEIVTPYIIAEIGSPRPERFLFEGRFSEDSDNELEFLSVTIPPRSMRANVWASLDGINKLSADGSADGFQVTFWAEEPMFESLRLNSNGASLDARFDLRVEYKPLRSCDDIFADTTKLGRGARCVWKGPTRLNIVIGKGDNLIGVGDELALKEDAVRNFKQEYSYAATGSQAVQGPTRTVQVRARLRGTERITSCGKVKMTARKSKGGAGREMTYAWTVASSGDVTAINALLSGYSKPDLTFDGGIMDAETIYTFEMTATNFLGVSDTDFIEVSRSATATPEVEIIPRGVDIANALISERFKLTAEVTFYSDCVPPGKTVFLWSVNNEDVPLNLRTINRRTLYVDANTLPGNENLTFTITIYKESDPEKYINQSITITTSYSELQTVIEGGNELTIGRDAGNVTIDGTASFDPDNVAMDMTYEWFCEQVTDETACWSYKEGEEGEFIISADATTQPVLRYDALAMIPEKTYAFTLVTIKGSRSSTASVNVLAMNGDPPRVNIQPIQGKVRSDKVFKLRAKIRHTSTLAGVEWTTADTEVPEDAEDDAEAFAFLDLADEANLLSASSLHRVDNTHSVAFLSIKPGKLTPGSAYMFQLNVTTVDGLFGLAKIDVHILAEVTSCSFGLADGVNEYTELDKVEMLVADCVADETAYPLSYQIFLQKEDGSFEAFTERQSEPLIEGVGKPAREGTTANTFVARVCDNFRGCATFTQEFSVTTKDTFTEEEAQVLKETLVDEEKYKQNYVAALVNYNTISQKVDISFNSTGVSNNSTRRRRAAAEVTTAQAAEQLELMELVLANTVLDTASAQLQIDQLSSFTVTDMTLVDQDRFLNIIIELVGVFTANGEETISESGIDTVLALTLTISQDLDPTYNAAILEKVEEIEGALSVSRLGDLVVGGEPIEMVTDIMVTKLHLAIPDGVFYSKSSGGVAIDFGSDISSRFGADWACSTGSCTGVAIHYDHYDTTTDKISTTEEDKNARAADIVAIHILDPASGEEILIQDLSDPISITMTLTLPKDNSYYECTSWNETTEEWITDGIDTVKNSATEIECLSSHLSQFTVMAQANPTTDLPTGTTGTTESGDKAEKGSSIYPLIGGVVGGVVLVVLASVVGAFLWKRHRARTQRRQVSNGDTENN